MANRPTVPTSWVDMEFLLTDLLVSYVIYFDLKVTPFPTSLPSVVVTRGEVTVEPLHQAVQEEAMEARPWNSIHEYHKVGPLPVISREF